MWLILEFHFYLNNLRRPFWSLADACFYIDNSLLLVYASLYVLKYVCVMFLISIIIIIIIIAVITNNNSNNNTNDNNNYINND